MWVNTEIEKVFLEKSNENQYWSTYAYCKEYFCRELYSNISRVEPNLTDHGETHISNVLKNAYKLLAKDVLNVHELYTLCMSILIHDIGNLSGRVNHEVKLKNYFNRTIFPTIQSDHITLISQIASKHGGDNCDAINTLSDASHIDGEQVRAQKIASILRFADELAEGKQRTSTVLLEHDLIGEGSKLYHVYAEILKEPLIQKDTVSLVYDIRLHKYTSKELNELLALLFKRIKKLDKERIYCGHYCNDVQNIKKVAISINFYKDKDDFEPINFQDNKLINFELSSKNIHCDEQNKNGNIVEKILKELDNLKQANAIVETKNVGLLEKIKKWWSIP